jgi:hypothetical protein
MPAPRRKPLWITVGVSIVLMAVLVVFLNGRATAWIDGEGFRSLLDRETSKGMKFEGRFEPLRRVGLLGLATDGFTGEKGQKTIVSLQARHVTGWFNPLGIALRHWEIHDVHIQTGTVWLQKTNPTPGEPKGQKPIPWTALFWPYRVELEDVKCDDADVLFRLQEKESGIYHTALDVTPNGRDFEYDARGGIFRTPLTPPLQISHIHLLVRKPRLDCEVFTLCEDPAHPEQQLAMTGHAGLQDDRSIDAMAEMKSLPVTPFLPESIRSTGSPDPGELHFRTFRTDIRYEKGAITMENFEAECPGVLKVTGTVTAAKDKTLSGELRVGLAPAYLKWLPTARTAIFTEADGDYAVTVVHVSGTMEKPQQDLSARVIKELEKSPGTAIKLFFNAL